MAKSPKTVDVSIVIVTWNVADLLRKCLNSIQRYAAHKLSLQIIVVDNNSTDETVELVRREFKRVTLIANETNVGFAKANNQAFNICTGDFVLLLNPDTEIYEGSLEAMVDFLKHHLDYGAVGPKLVSTDHTVWYEGARNFPTILDVVAEAFTLRRLLPRSKVFGGLLMSYWDHQSDRDVDCLQGACMLVRRSVLFQVGLLDEALFMYFEDVDLCYRIRSSGFRIRYCASSVVLHIWQGSTTRSLEKEQRMVKLAYQSYYFFFKKHKSWIHSELVRGIVVCGGIFRVLIFSALSILDPKKQVARGKGYLMVNSMRSGELKIAGRE